MILKSSFCVFKRSLSFIRDNWTRRSLATVKMENQFSEEPLVAICHMRSTSDKKSNMEQVCEIIKRAKEKQASFLFFPECCDFVAENRNQYMESSEPLTGPTVEKYKNLAKTNKMWISIGGFHESVVDSKGNKVGKVYNTHIVIDDCGSVVAAYRKIHLFDVETPEYRFQESKLVEKGTEIVAPVDTPVGKIGLQICYDLRFPEVALILRKLGATVLTYPSAFTYTTGKAHWSTLLKARAIETQCYVIASAQIGYHNEKRRSYGHGMIVDPWGEIIAECEEKDLDVVVTKLDTKKLEKVRKNMPCFEHRRNDLYSLCPWVVKEKFTPTDMKFGPYTIPAETIFYLSKHCYAFTNIRCVVPGHILIATKEPAKRLQDLNSEEISDLFLSTVKVQNLMEKYYGVSSTNVTVQDGEEAGQTVSHVHVHILPRRKGDFDYTDKVYVELRKHDLNPTEERRPLEEMINEANLYRKFMTLHHIY